jgi:hypothetical protein
MLLTVSKGHRSSAGDRSLKRDLRGAVGDGGQNLAYRPARPPHTLPPAPTEGRSGVDQEERSRYFSWFLTASRRPTARQRPEKSILHAGAEWHPVDLVQPDHAAARGQPSTELVCASSPLPSGWRVVALQEVEGMPRPGPPDQSQQFLWLVIPEICLTAGEGISWLGAGSLRRSSTALQRSGP